MKDYKLIIEEETKKIIECTKELLKLEMNFRSYLDEFGLAEANYKKAACEYSEAIIPMKEKISKIQNLLNEMNYDVTEKTEYTNKEDLEEFNITLGKIWRMIVLNRAFTIDYGGLQLGDEEKPNLYKEIYDKHLVEVEEFMYYFIKTANILFSK